MISPLKIFKSHHHQLLESCISNKNLTLGSQIHSQVITSGLQNDRSLSAKLITLYSQCQAIPSAQTLFAQFPNRSAFLLNSVIRGLSFNRLHQEAIDLFCVERKRGLEPDSYTFSCVLKACASLSDLCQGKILHQVLVVCGFESDIFASNSLIAMYAKCGSLESSVKVFERMPQRDIVSWNSTVSAYAVNGFEIEALEKVRELVESGLKPNQATIVSTLALCFDDGATVKEIHGYALRSGNESDPMVQNALVSAYGKCNLTLEARGVFNLLSVKDRVSWNAMIACCAQNGLFEESLGLLRDMKLSGYEMDVVTYSGIVSSFAQNELSSQALSVFKEMLSVELKPDVVAIASILPVVSCVNYCKEIHAYSYRHGLESDRKVRNALVSLYGTYGRVQDAERVFNSIDNRDVISWSSMVVGYSQNQHFVKALSVYREMVSADTEPNPITVTSALSACAAVSGMLLGKELHCWATKKSLAGQSFVGCSLIDMYAKCGRINDSRKVFDLMPDKNVVAWNSMIGGCAMHGLGEDALQLFYTLKEPNDISFITALSACSHGGLVEDGIGIFNSMKDFDVSPKEAHYACVVDLLARSGRTGEALDLVRMMPLKASSEVWGVLLGACKVHSDLRVGLHSGAQIVQSGSRNSGYYVLLANMFADFGRWGEVEVTRDMMKDKGVKKGAGCSWVEVDKSFHSFVAKERTHPEWGKLFRVLSFLNEQMK